MIATLWSTWCFLPCTYEKRYWGGYITSSRSHAQYSNPDLFACAASRALYGFLDMEEAAQESWPCFWNMLPSHCSGYLEIKTDGDGQVIWQFCNFRRCKEGRAVSASWSFSWPTLGSLSYLFCFQQIFLLYILNVGDAIYPQWLIIGKNEALMVNRGIN